MGIYRFYSQFLSKIGERVIIRGLPQRLSPHGVEGVVFDLNGMLHNVAQRVFMYGKTKQDAVKKGMLEEFRAAKSLQNRKTFEELMDLYVQELAKELNETLTVLSPKQYVVIAIDGMVPSAKILQQRSRRYKTFIDLSSSSSSSGGGEGGGGGAAAAAISYATSDDDKPIGGFDTTMISPGTPFMNDVDTYLRAWLTQGLEKRKEWVKMISRSSSRIPAGTKPPSPPRGLLPGVIHYSSHLVNGEGEHKAFAAIREFLQDFSIVQGSGAHIVYGADADLSMLSLLSPLRNILLSRENLSQFIDIEELYLEIRKRMTRDGTSLSASFTRETITRDFVVISNLIGNDFLPSSAAFQTMGTLLLDAYAKIEAPLTTTTTNSSSSTNQNSSDIILSSLGNFFYVLSTNEPSMLIENAKSELRDVGTSRARVSPSRDLLGAYSLKTETLNFELFRRGWYEKAATLRNESISQSLPYYETVLQGERERGTLPYLFTSTSQTMRRMVCDYVATISWVLRYYESGGDSINWLHSYRFVVAPLANDVANVIINEFPKVTAASSSPKASKSSSVATKTTVDFYAASCSLASDGGSTGFTNKDGDPRARGKSAIPLSTQLLIITPPSQIEKVLASSKDLAMLTSSDSGPLAFIAPDDPSSIYIYLDGKRAKYEGIPILPEIDFIRVAEIIKNYEALYRRTKVEESKLKREKKESEGFGPHIDKFGVSKFVPIKVKALIPLKLSSTDGDEPIVFKPSEIVREAIAKRFGKEITTFTKKEGEREMAALQIESSKTAKAVGEGEMGGVGRWGVGSIEDLEKELEIIQSSPPPQPQPQQRRRHPSKTREKKATVPADVVLPSQKPPRALSPKKVSSFFPSTLTLLQTEEVSSTAVEETKKPRKPRSKKVADAVDIAVAVASGEEDDDVRPKPTQKIVRKPRAKKVA